MRLLYLGPPDTLEHVRGNLPEDYEVSFATDDTTTDQHIATSHIVLDAYMRVHFPADRIRRAHNLKLFVTATTGADHVDAIALGERRIPLLTLKGQHTVLRTLTPAAEHSWLLLMACARRLNAAIHAVLSGDWDRNKHPGIMLRGRTLGIIGCGRIGQWMSRYALAFGMTCLGYDPYVDPWPENIQRSDLDSLLRTSDFVSLHVPLTADTCRLLGPSEFQLIKRGAVLINTSRGDVIDESELLYALADGRLSAAGLDVLTGEPDVAHHPLVEHARTYNNLIITPHIGGFSPDALRYVLSFSCQRIIDFFQAQS